MAIISFEKIAGDVTIAEVPDGFRRLNWDNFLAADAEYLEARFGITNAVRTGEAAALNDFGESAGFESPDRDDDFDLNNGYFTAFDAADLPVNVKVVGFDDGKKVAAKVLVLDADREFVRFGAQFDDIDEVGFKVKGGTDPAPNEAAPFPPFFLVDDLFIDF